MKFRNFKKWLYRRSSFILMKNIPYAKKIKKISHNRKKIPCFLRVLWYSVYMKKEINTIEQAKNLSTLEFMDLSPLERKLIDELKRVESQVELLQEWLDNSHRTSELLRNARDNYRRQLGISSDWDTMESVRDKYDARHGG